MQPLRNYVRAFLFYIVIPAVALLVLFFVADNMIMPVITRHGEEFALPDITGKTEFEAEEILARSNLTFEVAGREYSSDRPEGVILTQMPEAGTRIKSGRSIKIVVSAGTRLAVIPDISGLPLSEADIMLQKAGFATGEIYYVQIDTLPKNTAIETIPSRGTRLPMGSKVSIAVNQGSESSIVTVPSVLGLPLERARERLESAGLLVGDIKRKKEERYLPNTVLEQDPRRDEQVSRGDRVKLTVSKTD